MMSTKVLYALIAVLTPLTCFAQQRIDVFADPKNLQVLPMDISSEDLKNTMRGFSMGVGVRCETCHVGEPNTPLSEFDFESDEKEMKQKARLMLQMVNEINGNLVPRLNEVEKTSRVDVRCVTCHRGQPQPKLIEDVMDEQLAADGVNAAVEKYKALRDDNYGGHSFDFSEHVLPMYTEGLAAAGQNGAAIALAELNAGYFPDSYYTAYVLGEFYVAAGKNEAALKNYERALELNPRAERMLGPKIQALIDQ
jgi:tetratricopeptide (TPR) repeat protein